MRYWVSFFFVIAFAAALCGFGGLAVPAAAGCAKSVFFVFLMLGVLSLISERRSPT
jgi:uncharacterized membrane protein YtjA (UPF0391 family)